jgi:hypothetical protein
MSNLTITQTLTTELTPEQFTDLVINAVESGPYGSIMYDAPAKAEFPGCPSRRIAAALLAGRPVPVTSLWDPQDSEYYTELTLASVREGLATEATRLGRSPTWIVEDGDVNDADNVMQTAAWGEPVYG